MKRFSMNVLIIVSLCMCALVPARSVGPGLSVPCSKVPKPDELKPLEVTLDVYSGVSNPAWTVNPGDALHHTLFLLLHDYESTPLLSSLGYRGFKINGSPNSGSGVSQTVAAGSNRDLESILLYTGLQSSDPSIVGIVQELLCHKTNADTFCNALPTTTGPTSLSTVESTSQTATYPFPSAATHTSVDFPSQEPRDFLFPTAIGPSLAPDPTVPTSAGSSPTPTDSTMPTGYGSSSSTPTAFTSPTSSVPSHSPTGITLATKTSSDSHEPTGSTSPTLSVSSTSATTGSTWFSSTFSTNASSLTPSSSYSTSMTSGSSSPTTPGTSTSMPSSSPLSTATTSPSVSTGPTSYSPTDPSVTPTYSSTQTSSSSTATTGSPSQTFSSVTPGPQSTTPKPCNGSCPKYKPGKWNNNPNDKANNNCYNYATNSKTGTFAQPGRGSGSTYTSLTGAAVKAAAMRDGLKVVANPASVKNGECVVALVIWPGRDFHWYRQDQSGNWSHKPGSTSATDLDNSGNVITDPRTADTGNYKFVAFMSYCPGQIKVRR